MTCLAVDPGSIFVLSGSSDAVVHVWSILSLLSFESSDSGDSSQESPFSPLRSLTNHRAAITDVVTGHSHSRTNIAVSASKDKTCVIWEYENGTTLRTFLLQDQPLCLALDPVDRALYAGYQNGSVQFMDFYDSDGHRQPQHIATPQSTPVQPPPAALWPALNDPGSSLLCLQVSYDGTQLLSGHEDGKIHTWDIATGKNGKPLADFAAPVTNLEMMKPTGFVNPASPSVKLQNVIKPRYQSFANGYHHSGLPIPEDYTFTAQFLTDLRPSRSRGTGLYSHMTSDSCLPISFYEAAIADIQSREDRSTNAANPPDVADLRAHNESLKDQLQKVSESRQKILKKMEDRNKEDWRRQKDSEIKAVKKKQRRLRKLKLAKIARRKEMGEKLEEENDGMDVESEPEESLSSSTDELTDG